MQGGRGTVIVCVGGGIVGRGGITVCQELEALTLVLQAALAQVVAVAAFATRGCKVRVVGGGGGGVWSLLKQLD
jgi:hypothetical protein